MRKPVRIISWWVLPLFFLFMSPAKAQQTLTTINGWNAYVHLPADYNSTTNTYPTIVFLPGIGEVGTVASKVISNGPGAYIAQGWNGNVIANGSNVSFIVISLQPPSGYPSEALLNQRLQTIKSLYRVNTNRLYLTGLSHGGWCSSTFITGDAYNGPYTYASQIAAVVTVEGVIPDDNQPYPNLFDNYARSGGRYLGFEQMLDGRDTRTVVNRMNATVPNSGIYVQTNFGGGGHCCWNQFYGGQGTQPGNFLLDGVGQNLYQWMAKQYLGPTPNIAPTANAGTNQVIDFPVVVANLSGSGTDPDGTIASYSWRRTAGPLATVITNANAANATAINLVPGNYSFELTVTDNAGATAKDTVDILVNGVLAPNIPPVVNAGNDTLITIPPASFALSGVANDPDGSITSYLWSQASGPSTSIITNNTSNNAVASSLVTGIYRFVLRVTDNSNAVTTDTIQVKVNVAPIVNAGADISITHPVNNATLNGTATDANGTVVSYSWSQASGPATAGIATSTAATTNITALIEGQYSFILEARDNDGADGKDTVLVNVVAPQPIPNNIPVVFAGNDTTIVLPTDSLHLAGTATDTDGTIINYSWIQSAGPSAATILHADSAGTLVKSLSAGQYKFVFTATDNSGASVADTIIISVQSGVNILPAANAGADTSIILPLNNITLIGTGTDADGTISNYGWAQLSGPSTAAITPAGAGSAIFSALVQGVYRFELTVTDNSNGIGKDTIAVTVFPAVNQAPVANAGQDTSITLPVNFVTLRGSATDADGTISSYTWSQANGPAAATFISATNPITIVNNLVAGQYQFVLTVRDNSNAVASDTVLVTVNPAPNQAPVANAGIDVIVTLPLNTASLAGTGTDADGTIAGYLWAQVSGPSAATIVSATSANTAVNNMVQGQYKFSLKVTDNNGATGLDTVSVFVNAPACNSSQPVTYILNPTSPGEIYIPDASTRPWKGGDTLKIPAGNYSVIEISKLKGDECRKIIIINSGGRVFTPVLRFKNDAKYFRITGSGTAGIEYGFKITGGALAFSLVHDVEADHIEMTGGNLGIYCKTTPTETDMRTVYIAGSTSNYVMSNIFIHHNYIHNVSGEGMYIGHSNPNGGQDGNGSNGLPLLPLRMDNIEIANNRVEDTDWDGIQLSNARNNARIHDNIVRNFGRINLGSQQAGIILGGNTSGEVYNNSVTKGTGNGIEVFGYGLIKLYGNFVDSTGWDGTSTGQESVFLNDLSTTPEINPKQQIQFYNNNVDHPKTKAAVRVSNYNNNSLPASVYNNKFCIPNAPANWQNIYLLINAPGSTQSNNTLFCAATTNAAPVSNAGPDKVITLPLNTVTLAGTGTDSDGTITAYQWTKITGPAATITNVNQATTTVTGMVQGVYNFELLVTDNAGALAKDTVQVTVNAAVNQAPVANAGVDQTITLPINTTTLNGSGTDTDGTIASYLWTKISGPAATISTPALASTGITGLVQGVYKFQLQVADNAGAIGRDTIQVTVITPANNAPFANAGPDKTITLPVNTTTLVGSGTDSDGTISGYQWTKISGPVAGTITNATAATATISALAQGVYKFELLVIDNNGAVGFDTMQLTVNPAPNAAPIANAGADKSVTLPVNSTTLVGSGTDSDGTITGYLWTKLTGPTTGTISNAGAATATAISLIQGVYTFELRVTDNNGAYGRDTMRVIVNPPANIPPVANAGLNQNITLPVSSSPLNGSGTDQDGTVIAYLWTKVSGPAQGSISNATSAAASATGMVQGVYRYELRVTDNNGAYGRDTMQVTVNASVPLPNIAPAANAGLDQNITLPVNTAPLNGSGTDPDGTITAYLWTKISGPAAGTISNAAAAITTAVGLAQGTYRFELRVTDNSGATGRDTMLVIVNPALNVLPVVNAGPDKVITLPVNTTSLNGTATDTDGSIVFYQWLKISGPSQGVITNANTASATATSLVQGIYVYEFSARDNSGATSKDTMQVTVNPAPNMPPVANAGLDQNITLPNSTANLTGSGTDPDGTIIAYLWTKISGPAAGNVSNATAGATQATGLSAGVYRFELRVTDNNGAIGRDTMQVNVNPAVNMPPLANAGPDKTITLPVNTTTLQGSGTDPDGAVVAYQWIKISGPVAGSITNPAAAVTTAVSLVQGVYKFELTVTDNSGATAKDTMQVSVNPAANIPPVANAGGDKTITLPVNTTVLNGSGMDADGTISGYFWTKLSGPAAGDIINATSAVTNITNLVEAVYTFELRVTDNNGAIGRDTIRVTVLPAVPQNNQLPMANAGNNISITLPENSTALSGSGSDPDGMIVGYSWAKIAGPSAGNVMNATAASAMASGLVQGIYLFELKVTDNSGGTGRDTVQVTVHPAVSVPNASPIANAGPDSTITLPENRLRLQGSGMDTDGTIVNYQWRILSGPIHYFLANANDPRSEFSELEEGIYKLELLVTDDDGAIGRDTVIISIAEGLDKPDVNTVDIYPNPVPDMMRARIGSTTESEVMLVLYDSKGGTLFSKRIVTVAGQQVESIPMQKYAHGTYFLEITFRGQKPIMKKILKL